MLERLSEFNWSQADVAAGCATDVPDQLRALVTGGAAEHPAQFNKLREQLVRDGRIYSASVLAIRTPTLGTAGNRSAIVRTTDAENAWWTLTARTGRSRSATPCLVARAGTATSDPPVRTRRSNGHR